MSSTNRIVRKGTCSGVLATMSASRSADGSAKVQAAPAMNSMSKGASTSMRSDRHWRRLSDHERVSTRRMGWTSGSAVLDVEVASLEEAAEGAASGILVHLQV